MDYGTGVGVAFLLWFWYATNLVIQINSQTQRNLKKLGMRGKWASKGFEEWTAADAARPKGWAVTKYLACVGIALPFVLLSWLYVAYYVGATLWTWSRDLGAPQSVKEYRWKLRNVDLPFVDLVREVWKLNESNLPFDDFLAATADEVQAKGLPTPGWVDHRPQMVDLSAYGAGSKHRV